MSEERLDGLRNIWDEELRLDPQEASEILAGFDKVFGHLSKIVIFHEDFCSSLVNNSIADYKRIDVDRLFVFASGEDEAVGEQQWIKFCYEINTKQKKELGRLLFLIYSDDQGASVSIDTVVAASQKAVGKYQHHVSEWAESGGEGRSAADSDPKHRQVCFEITGGKRYFNMEQFNTYVERHHHIGYGLVNMQRELQSLTGGFAMWDKISRRRVKALLSGMTKKEKRAMERERKERKAKEERRNKKVKQEDTLMKRLRRI